jgi:glycosyltransferase involved in cell wall biosynthesis
VIVVSNKLREHVRALGVPARKIHVMPNGVNPELFFPNGAGRGLQSASPSPASKSKVIQSLLQFVRRSGLKPALLGFVGGLRPWHGVEVLPELLARLSKHHPHLRLMIAGDGPLRDELERAFRQRGLARRVTFTGALLHEQVPDVIRHFDVALAPYPQHDHDFYFSPLKLFEYMACGVAVVAARQGQVAEVVRHGETGLLYPPGNLAALTAHCDRLLGDAALRRRLGAAAAKVVRARLTWDRNAASVVKLARSLVAGRRPSE